MVSRYSTSWLTLQICRALICLLGLACAVLSCSIQCAKKQQNTQQEHESDHDGAKAFVVDVLVQLIADEGTEYESGRGEAGVPADFFCEEAVSSLPEEYADAVDEEQALQGGPELAGWPAAKRSVNDRGWTVGGVGGT